MMYAVIATGGKQHKVSVGDQIRVETLEAGVGDTITFDEVLAVKSGDDLKVGQRLTVWKDGAIVAGFAEEDEAPVGMFLRGEHDEFLVDAQVDHARVADKPMVALTETQDFRVTGGGMPESAGIAGAGEMGGVDARQDALDF